VHHRDALTLRVDDAIDRDFAAVAEDGAGIRLMDAAEDLHQRTLAGAILAGERMHLAGAKAEVDPAQHLDRAEALCNAAKFDFRGHADSRDRRAE